MARKKGPPLDLAALEADWRCGIHTSKQLAEKYGITDQYVRLLAMEHGWKQDLTDKIRRRARAKISEIDVEEMIERVAQQRADTDAATMGEVLESAADALAGIMKRHRKTLAKTSDRVDALEAIMDNEMASIEGIRDVQTATQCLKNLSDVRIKLIEMERAVYGLDKEPEKPATVETVTDDELDRALAKFAAQAGFCPAAAGTGEA